MLIMKPVFAVKALDHVVVDEFGLMWLATDAVDVEKTRIVVIFII